MTTPNTAPDPVTAEEAEVEAALQAAALGRLEAAREARRSDRRFYTQSDFLYDASQAAYWCLPTRSLLPAVSVNALIPVEHWRIPMREARNGRPPQPVPPARDIARIESGTIVEGSTWLPGAAEVIDDIFATKDGFFPLAGARTYNTYVPGPEIERMTPEAAAAAAAPWIKHVKFLWPEPVEHNFFFDYFAHAVQRPGEKSNSAIVLSGSQGVGKDAALFPVRYGVGEWNCRNIGPDDILSNDNSWAQCVILTVDEVRPMHEDHKATTMYDAMKALITTPPTTIPIKEKYEKRRYIANILRLVMTTNDRLSLYIPPEDRRIMMLHTEVRSGWHLDADPGYYKRLFDWMLNGGCAAVAAYLATRDISEYQPQGEVPKTEAWHEIAQRWEAPEDEVTQALDILGRPEVVLSSELQEQTFDGVEELRRLMKGRGFVFRMQQAGYRLVPLPKGKEDWFAQANGYRVKSRKAYVREDSKLRRNDAVEAVEARIKARAEAGAAGLKAPKPDHLKAVT